jgi:hypothetical protein
MRLSKKLVAIPYERAYGEPNQNVVFDNLLHELAGGPGFEPGLTESESAILPLNHPPPDVGLGKVGEIALRSTINQMHIERLLRAAS